MVPQKVRNAVTPAKAGVQNLLKTLDDRYASLRVPPCMTKVDDT